MARRSILFVLVTLLLAACATTKPRQIALEDDSAVVYQVGVTTRYSVSMDELSPKASVQRQNRLPHAVVAGDQSLTVAASLFRRGEIFTLDLIVQNQSDHRFDIDRTRFDLFDDRGSHLMDVYDWPAGETVGLRSIQEFRRDYAHMGRDFEDTRHGKDGDGSEKRSAKHVPGSQRVNATKSLELADNPVNSDYSWINDLQFHDQTVVLPTICELFPGQSRAYWAYFQVPKRESGATAKLQFPLTATIVVDGKRMLFRFEDPGQTSSAR